MVSSLKYLAKCSKLKDSGVTFDFEQGSFIARGFADLGFEEFIVLTSNKILSIYSGKISGLPEEDKKNFFAVPSIELMINKIRIAGFDILGLTYESQRTWQLKVENKMMNIVKSYDSDSLNQVILDCLVNIYENL